MDNTLASIPVIPSVAPLTETYKVWLCDIWGVMHNGVTSFPDAADACIRFREQGGTVILISNSPRPGPAVARQMSEIGVPDGTYDAIVTSGDTTRQVIEERKETPVFHLGPERDKPLLDGIDVKKVSALEEAGYVLCSGLYDDLTETPEDYAELLGEMHSRALPMLCANPDIQVERGDRLIYCAGALAAAYAELGGEVIYTGKPHAPIYERACSLASTARNEEISRKHVLCIGDGIKTDMAGAAASGMDALFVASGLHMGTISHDSPLTAGKLEEAFAGVNMRPIAAQTALKW